MKVSLPGTSRAPSRRALARAIDRTAGAMDMEDADVARCMSFFLEYVADEVTKGYEVPLPGFGTIFPVTRGARVSGPRQKPHAYALPKFVASAPFRWQVAHGAPPKDEHAHRAKVAQANATRRSKSHARVFTAQAAIREAIAKQLARDLDD